MKICYSCKKEMRCVKTGFTVRWGESHCYRGDKFRCPECGTEIVMCNTSPFQSLKEWPEDEFLQMPDRTTHE
jgi:predicted RNA-binding Zn-ribbon protein involved in translation (DUF1610 family)